MKFTKTPNLDLFESSLSEKSILKKFQIFGAHEDLCDRLKKTLYYGRLPKSPRTSLPLTEAAVELFSKTVPKGKLGIINSDFASTVSKKASISPCSLMLALVYLERLRHKNPEYLRTVSSCDLFLVSMMVASKYLFDDGEEEELFNDEWASLVNMDSKEINCLERDFLAAIEWELFVKPETFFEMLHEIETKIAQQEASKRGWLTYTDIHMLSGKSLLLYCLKLLYEDVLKVVMVSTVAYVSALATLATALTLSHHCTALMTQPFKTAANQIVTISNHSESSFFLPPMHSTSKKDLPLNSRDPVELNFDCDSVPNNVACQFRPSNKSYHNGILIFEKYDHFGGEKNLDFDYFFAGVRNNLAAALSALRTVFEGITITRGKKEEFRDNFQYIPTCCGGVNSYFL